MRALPRARWEIWENDNSAQRAGWAHSGSSWRELELELKSELRVELERKLAGLSAN